MVDEVDWTPPAWLLSHQVDAARRLAGMLSTFHGAILADAVGLGKTYVALALAQRAGGASVIAPAALASQWHRAAARHRVSITFTSHEALSRGARPPSGPLLLVDEAHRFRNPATRRYDALARMAAKRDTLLITATPVVNGPADLLALLRLFLGDGALAGFGVPSLARAIDDRRDGELIRAAATVILGRSPTVARAVGRLPVPIDSSLVRPPPVPRPLLSAIVRGTSDLRFPGFGPEASQLLRQHLRFRLASSPDALLETLRRHRTYVARALEAAERGQRLSRGAARLMFTRDDDMQLSFRLDDPTAHIGVVNPDGFRAEARRLDTLTHLLPPNTRSPKVETLRRILRRRNGSRTIVFTGAVATARRLARALDWRGVCLATGAGARIASGPLPLDEALALFAPEARGTAPPPPHLAAHVLIATDLVSEGLDLQDADAIVHFDLPWTPLRLQQRLGRVARLGSRNETVQVWWLAPPVLLDRSLGLTRRLHRKADAQFGLAVTTSSRPGRARIVGGDLESRERLVVRSPPGDGGWHRVDAPGCAFALSWPVGDRLVRELVVFDGEGNLLGWRDAAQTLARLARAPIRADLRCSPCTTRIVRLLRVRLASLLCPQPGTAATRRLARRVLELAHRAGRRRDVVALRALDGMLGRIRAGLPVGAERDLDRLLFHGPVDTLGLEQWLRAFPPRDPRWGDPLIEAALIGSFAASTPTLASRRSR